MYALYYKVRWYVGIALLLCLAITIMKYSAWIDGKLFGTSQRPRDVAQQSVQPGQQAVSGTASATPSQAALPSSNADVHDQLSQAQSLLEEAATNASEALGQAMTWQSDVESLRAQAFEEPRATGAGSGAGDAEDSSQLFDRLAYVMRRERTSAQDLGDAANRIKTLQLKIDDSLKRSSPAALSPIEIAEITQLHATCKQAKEDWHRDVEQALAIKHLLEAQSETQPRPATPTTIGSRIKESDAKAAVARLDRQMVREEEEEAARRAREAELAEQRRQQVEREAELLAEATSPEVKAVLAPFLEPRTIQPSLSGGFSINWVRSLDKKPMSLGKLIGIGALDDSVEGLKKLALVGGNRKLPEPKWSIASQPNNWSPDDEERLKRAQQMLQEYGEILVKAGLLSE